MLTDGLDGSRTKEQTVYRTPASVAVYDQNQDTRSRFWRGARLVLTGMCVVVIAASSFYFALVSDRYARQIDVSEEAVVLISSTLYVAAVISSVMSVLLSER